MAVVDTESHSRSGASSHSASGGSFFKKNKKAVLIGGGVLGLLLISSKGKNGNSSSSATDPNQQLQAEADALAAQQQQQLADNPVYGSAGSGGDSSGSSSDGSSAGGNSSTAPDPSQATTYPGVLPPGYDPGTVLTPSGAPDPTGPNDVPSNEPATPGTQPPDKHGKTRGKASGHKHANPENKGHNTGHGVTVHGRTFAGGRHATMHPPRKVGGNVHQKVTINHGGYTSTHVSVNNGKSWIDNPRGSTPPKRGVPVHHSSEPIPRPVNRPAAQPRKPVYINHGPARMPVHKRK